MAICVDRNKCDGCGRAVEPRCMLVCPGDLFYRDEEHKAALRDPRDCWDCAACLKECPRGALKMYLPAETGGRGSTLSASAVPGGLLWTLTSPAGKQQHYLVPRTKDAVKGGKNDD